MFAGLTKLLVKGQYELYCTGGRHAFFHNLYTDMISEYFFTRKTQKSWQTPLYDKTAWTIFLLNENLWLFHMIIYTAEDPEEGHLLPHTR